MGGKNHQLEFDDIFEQQKSLVFAGLNVKRLYILFSGILKRGMSEGGGERQIFSYSFLYFSKLP